jgi:hypothetical protein
MRYFRGTGMIFPRLPLVFTFDGILSHMGAIFAIGSE